MYKETEFFENLTRLISFKSVLSEPKEGAPFGEGINAALEYFLSLAKSFGFETVNYSGYLGEVTFGQGEEIGIIGHLDVVPEGSGWLTPPFTLTEKDGVLYGRGLADDKTPMLICLYALKKLKDEGVRFNKKVRLFVGTDEESGWRDVAYFKRERSFPEYGFSPDGNFPVSYAEKGMSEVTFKIAKLKNFSCLQGGTVVNAVCAYAEATPAFKVDINELKPFSLSFEGGKIVSRGVSCHGSRPELGVNALKNLFEYFAFKGENVNAINDFLFNDKWNISELKNEQGAVTISPDILKETDSGVEITCDLRIPAPFQFKLVKKKLDLAAVLYEVKTRHEPLLVEKEGEFVKTLLSAYEFVTGLKGEPISQGGSTFARAFKKGCAFGPEFLGEPSTIHEANERIKKQDIYTLFDIYALAIERLVK